LIGSETQRRWITLNGYYASRNFRATERLLSLDTVHRLPKPRAARVMCYMRALYDRVAIDVVPNCSRSKVKSHCFRTRLGD